MRNERTTRLERWTSHVVDLTQFATELHHLVSVLTLLVIAVGGLAAAIATFLQLR